MIIKRLLLLTLSIIVLCSGGCVERLIKVTSSPPGATVWLNDQEVGSTPLSVPFTWYGKYSVAIRKDGYESIISSRETETPLYQWPVLDFFAECILPWNFVDEHDWHYDLSELTEVDQNRLIIRAERMRIQSEAGLQDNDSERYIDGTVESTEN